MLAPDPVIRVELDRTFVSGVSHVTGIAENSEVLRLPEYRDGQQTYKKKILL
jgi:hypothetical protein